MDPASRDSHSDISLPAPRVIPDLYQPMLLRPLGIRMEWMICVAASSKFCPSWSDPAIAAPSIQSALSAHDVTAPAPMSDT
eukprot:4273312-Amphidinium_carterae.2